MGADIRLTQSPTPSMERRESKAIDQGRADSQRRGAKEVREERTGRQTGDSNNRKKKGRAQNHQERKHQIARTQARMQKRNGP